MTPLDPQVAELREQLRECRAQNARIKATNVELQRRLREMTASRNHYRTSWETLRDAVRAEGNVEIKG